MKRFMDTGSMLVAAITFVLFVAALFAKGLSHDLFLEAGIFLVSVKIILMNYRNNVAVSELSEKLDRVLATLAKKGN
jgi:hypothetical protein